MLHAFYRTAQGGEHRMPRSGDALGRSAKLMLRQSQAAFSLKRSKVWLWFSSEIAWAAVGEVIDAKTI